MDRSFLFVKGDNCGLGVWMGVGRKGLLIKGPWAIGGLAGTKLFAIIRSDVWLVLCCYMCI